MHYGQPAGFFASLPPTRSATKWLCGITLAVSALSSMAERNFSFGASQLVYRADAVVEGEFWRLFTYPFVERSFIGLMISLLIVWLFGRIYESRWGTRDFIKFYIAAGTGAGILAIPLAILLNVILPFQDVAVAEGPGAIITALLITMAITAPNSNILFGFVLPMRSRTLIYVMIGMELLSGMMNGAASLSVTLGGMAMGYLLVTGWWNPKRWANAIARRKKTNRTRRGLYVVPQSDRD